MPTVPDRRLGDVRATLRRVEGHLAAGGDPARPGGSPGSGDKNGASLSRVSEAVGIG